MPHGDPDRYDRSLISTYIYIYIPISRCCYVIHSYFVSSNLKNEIN